MTLVAPEAAHAEAFPSALFVILCLVALLRVMLGSPHALWDESPQPPANFMYVHVYCCGLWLGYGFRTNFAASGETRHGA